MAAAAFVRPTIGVFYFYAFVRIAENVVNHSGIDHPLLNILTLKILPGRASVSHHDYHHKYSNYSQ
jgi:sterol desaturase/sphingolipid hydroxylase (fatty acid hydroxylase superfamily)